MLLNYYSQSFLGGITVPYDYNTANTIFLPDGSAAAPTTFTDVSTGGTTKTLATTAAVWSSTHQVYGHDMIYIDGTTDFLGWNDSADWELGADYVINTWFYIDDLTNPFHILNQYQDTNNRCNVFWGSNGKLAWQIREGGNWYQMFDASSSTTVVSINKLYNLVLQYTGGVGRAWLTEFGQSTVEIAPGFTPDVRSWPALAGQMWQGKNTWNGIAITYGNGYQWGLINKGSAETGPIPPAHAYV